MTLPQRKRKVFVKSFGCQMNVYDATRMVDVLAPEGYDETADQEAADLIVLNTCHIRERASEKIFSELGKIRQIKQARATEGHEILVAVAGCVAQAEGAEIVRRQPAVDIVVGPQNYHRFPDLLRRARFGPQIDTEFPADDKFSSLPAAAPDRIRRRGVTAFLSIQEGCDKFCSFCVVPYTRGNEVSRPVSDIVAEAERFAAAGVRELTLLGQNVNAYHGEDGHGAAASLARLMERVGDVPGIERIRYMTSHPNDMDDDLIRAHGENPKVMPFLHLPVQSGSDRILAAMRRRHRIDKYLDIIDRVRRVRPDMAFSSDFIVGFPGETEADFDMTLELVRQVRFASAFTFKYSSRPGTPAADLPCQVDEPTMIERLARLQAILDEDRRTFNQATVGQQVEVLFEKSGRHPGQITGKTPYLQPVHVEQPAALIGEIGLVDVLSCTSNSLSGRLLRTIEGARC